MPRNRSARRHDDGSVLPLVLVLIVVGALIVIPVMTYSVSVLRANQVEQEKTRNVEAAKGAIRTALRQPGVAYGDKDRANAGCPDDDADLLPAGGEVVRGISVGLNCTPVSELSANEVFGFEVPVGAAQLQIAPAPSGFADYSGVVVSSPDAPPYPISGGAWWPSFAWVNPEDADDVTSIWVPDLPTFTDASRASTPLDMPGFDCKVFLPGRYEDPLNIDASGSTDNYYFASGVYYFEQPVAISGDVDVVVGQGLADFGLTNDCADDIQVGANVSVPADTIYAIDGNSGGATWLFGDQARLAISDSGGAPSVRFNQRYATQDRGGWINIASVNGDWSWDEADDVFCDADDDCFEDPDGNHIATNVNDVDRSEVVVRDVDDSLDIVDLGEPGALYTPSHPDLTDEARPPATPTAVSGTAVIAEGGASIEVTFRGVEGAATRGAIVDEYEAGVQVGDGSPPTPNPTSTCTTVGGNPLLVPTAEGADGADLWGRAHPENAGDSDEYSCLITGLTAGQTYWITARARNEAGWSDWAVPTQVSSSAWSVAPMAAPADPPSNVQVLTYDDPALTDAALVSWDESMVTNGAPVTGYDVQVYRVFLQDEATTTTSSTTTTTTTATTTSTTTTTTTTTLPPAGTDCGPPFDCASIPACPAGTEAIALYDDDDEEWDWSCETSCDPGQTLVMYRGDQTRCAPAGLGPCDWDEMPYYKAQGPPWDRWSCADFWRQSRRRIDHLYDGIPRTSCPSGTIGQFGYGTAFCAVTGPQPFRSLPRVVAPAQEPDPGTTTTSSTTTTTNPITYVEVEEFLDLADMRCSTEPRIGRTPEDAGLEWTPSPTQCVIPNLPPLPTTDGNGWENVGYRIKVTARTPVGSSAPVSSDPPFMALTGAPGTLDPLPPERVWFPYYNTSIIDIVTSGGGNTVVDIPGYVSVPMGRITIANSAGDDVSITGGVVAGRFVIDDPRSSLPYGYVPSVIMQRTVRLTATVGNIESTALVRINSDTSYGIVRWVTQ